MPDGFIDFYEFLRFPLDNTFTEIVYFPQTFAEPQIKTWGVKSADN
jgi:hypothetical protein